jgi:hypothetical protein
MRLALLAFLLGCVLIPGFGQIRLNCLMLAGHSAAFVSGAHLKKLTAWIFSRG